MRFEKFLPIAHAVAGLSKDPRRQVGAVAVNDDGILLAVGYNGFPRGVSDDPSRYADREIKLNLIAHAESNLVAQAAYAGHSLRGSTVLVSSKYPCSSCAKSLIQAGVKRIITPPPDPGSSWSVDASWSEIMFRESGVEIITVEATHELP